MISRASHPARRLLRTTVEASRARREQWSGLSIAKKRGVPVVAAFGLLPREIWLAMDVPFVGVEALALLLSSHGLSGRYCEAAEQAGFARGLCALHVSLAGIAVCAEREEYLRSLFVEPDLIIGSTFPCMAEGKTFEYWAERFRCPAHLVDVPINVSRHGKGGHAQRYLAGQLEGMIDFLVQRGFKYDELRMAGAVRNSRRMMELWREVEECRKAVPLPMTATDGLSCIGSTLISLLGSEVGVVLFEQLRDEVSGRVKEGRGVIDNERLRLYLVGVPPVYDLALLDYPEKYGAVVVKSDLDFIGGSLMDPALLDPEHPLESLALKQITDMVNPCFASRIDDAVRTVKEYRIDGVIGLNKRGCRNLPASLRLIKDAVSRETGAPMAILDLDGIDAREYNEVQVKANLDSFLETLAQQKGRA